MNTSAEIVTRTGAATRDAPRLLAGLRSDGRMLSLDEHRSVHGALELGMRGRDLISLVARSGITGRGGAAFPVARKLDAVGSARGRVVVVANGAEGEPPSGKDVVLLSYTPHLVLDGLLVAARAVGAREAVVAVSSRTAAAAVDAALAERRDPIAVRRVLVPDRFVAGEETALAQFLGGKAALPTYGARPFERGMLMQNVETLAHLALIARHGDDWFREAGTPEEPGTALFTLSGAMRHPGVFELPLGMPLQELVRQAGGATEELQAYLVGGYFGSWIAATGADDIPLSDAGLSRVGASLGARAIVALPRRACGIAESARVARYLAGESAGQCGPCVHGLAAIADDLETLARAKPVDLERLRRRLGVVSGRGACRHPDGAVRFVASALDVFAGEVDRHRERRRCAGTGVRVLPLPERQR